MVDNEKIRFVLPGVESIPAKSLAHGLASRGASAEELDLLAGVTVRQHFDLSAQQRAVGESVTTPPLAGDEVIALEMEGGFVLYTSAGRLADDLRRIDPKAELDGTISLEALRRQSPATRGLGEWMVRAFSVLGVDEKWLIGKAAEKAKEWGGEALVQGASWAGTKAVMWAIEEQLECKPGKLYAWSEEAGGELLAAAPANMDGHRDDSPMLVFIHGTGSSTHGSFGELRRATAEIEWLALRQKFGKHIYGFEHRTFSESPIENALQLARQLPAGARLILVTHSRGGLVGDLLCAAGYDGLIDTGFMRTDPRLAQANEEDRKNLQALAEVRKTKQFVIESYVRVACPAQGTLLASVHIDAFLSGLLHLIGMVPGVAGTPVYAAVKRVLLQIAKNRTDPRLVPGIEAMLPGSPLAALIGRAQPMDGARIAIVAGDIEGSGLLKRAGVFLTDYLLFEEENNDLVVDTESMFGGIARVSGHYVFDQGEDVSHFRYFANPRTRRALQAWITGEEPAAVTDFSPIMQDKPLTVMQRGLHDVTSTLPVVVFLPDVMGSHLSAKEERIWFDFLALGLGKLTEISWGRPEIAPDGVFDRCYGDLCFYLSRSHDVVPFGYDWRSPLDQTALLLKQAVEQALEKTEDAKQPVRLMTHGMGGLVVRAMIAHHRATWDKLVARADGHWVMLGTPNKGSHATVESLLGLSGTIRKLAMLHPPLGVQGVVDIVAGFPGVLQLLPRPGFRDTGDARHNYYAPSFWANFKQGNDSLWYGNNVGAIPAAEILETVKQAWSTLDEELPDPERIVYVAGYGYETPCGIEREEGKYRRLRMVGTLNGDGAVTHESGLLDVLKRNQRVWFMYADHAGLVSTEEHFPALLELLERGETFRLPQVKPTVRGAEALFRYEPGPVLYPTNQELEDALIGRRQPVPRQAKAKHVLTVRCRAMDLRHAVHPILVGHYEGDAISGAEAQIDRYLVNNRLTLRHHLDAYAGPVGTFAVVLDEPNETQANAGVRRGAIVVGLGSFGELKAAKLAAAVRQGVLRYLLQLHDRSLKRDQPKSVGITSVLLGYNSTTHISIEDSVAIVTGAVMEANRDFANASGAPLFVGHIEFVELFEDVAISAAKAVREIGSRLANDAKRLGFRIEPAQVLDCSQGMRPRIEAVPSSFDYWPRLIVTDETAEPTEAGQPGRARVLRYVFLSARARAEAVGHQRQPGLVESLLDKSIRFPHYQPELARALFHLLVPHEFKDTARQTDKLVLVVDKLTANLPWEMLVADDEPLIKTIAMVRQLTSRRFRPQVRATRQRCAYVVGNPSTIGYYKVFPQSSGKEALPDLPGAVAEARAVADLMIGLGYQVAEAPPGAEGTDVINRLYEKPYRILHISGHGVFEAGPAENRRTGVVLSNGLLLTAAEIAALEVVPDLVFLNCCHTGQINVGPETAYNRLAYSVAQELIDNGIRTVIVAGWAVDDNAARHFAEEFYKNFLREGSPFGKSVYQARLSTYESFPDSNTWGAFQAYGEPSYIIDPEIILMRDEDDFRPVAPQEIIARIELMRNELAHNRASGKRGDTQLHKTIERLLRRSASAAWLQAPEVLYPLGRLYADAKDFEQARQCYERAITLEDKRGQVPIVAIEQLANMEVRAGVERAEKNRVADGEALIRRGLDRLLGLTRVAGGTGELPGDLINAERCRLIGSAYKRLAKVLPQWNVPKAPVQPAGARQALEKARDWYARGQGDTKRLGLNAYNMQNRIVLDALLGTAKPEDAKLAIQAGEIAECLYEQTRDYFDLIMSADGVLIAALVDGAFEKPTEAEVQMVEARIVERYRGLREKLPETKRGLDSVISQIRLLAHFYKAQAEDERDTTTKVAECLERIASALENAQAPPERKPSQPEERLAGDEAMGEEMEASMSARRRTRAASKPADGFFSEM